MLLIKISIQVWTTSLLKLIVQSVMQFVTWIMFSYDNLQPLCVFLPTHILKKATWMYKEHKVMLANSLYSLFNALINIYIQVWTTSLLKLIVP
jgi:hypothetical protein